MDAERRNQGLEYARPISVGDNVWIGGGVHVMPGETELLMIWEVDEKKE